MRLNLLHDFLFLLYPDTCAACQTALQNQEKVFCTACRYFLPYTHYHRRHDNPVSRLFYGRINLAAATACFTFQKAGHVQELIHQFKYKGRKEVGLDIGRMLGRELKDAPDFKDTELIVPVPLHPQKLKKRGFNQSEIFAQGLAESMGLKLDTQSLVRTTATDTQTRKSRFHRWENVEATFRLQFPENIQGKHILLVDDVVTTGATLEACGNVLLKEEGVRVSVAAMAVA
jgi:ComF family protein